MKRFFAKSYSWLASLIMVVMFAMSGSAMAQDATFEFGSKGGSTWTIDNVTIKSTGGGVFTTNGINVWAGSWNMEVSAAAGFEIEKIELVSSNDLSTLKANCGEFNAATNTWTGAADAVIFSTNSDLYIQTVKVWTKKAEGGNTGGGDGIDLPLNCGYGTVGGVSFNYTSGDWASKANLYGAGGRGTAWGTIELSAGSIISKVELTCESGASTVIETENLGGSMSTSGKVAVWEGSATSLTFSSTSDIYVTGIRVYLDKNAVVEKDCSVDVREFAPNCKPGKIEEELSRWITIYMDANAAVTGWTGSHNCPEGVTFTAEDGEDIPVDQLNYWAGNDQIGIQLYESVTKLGTYTLHIPEGVVQFEGNKWNKEINATWTIVERDTRDRKAVEFVYAEGFVGEADGVTATTEGAYNASLQGINLSQGQTLSFAAPEGASIVGVDITRTTAFQNNYLQAMTADSGECSYSTETGVLSWTGDTQSVTFTAGANGTRIAQAVVTLAGNFPAYTEPVLSAEDVSDAVAYYIYTEQRGGLMVEDAEATTLRGTQEADPKYEVDPTDARQQFAFVNWQGNLYLYNLANEKFLGKGNSNKGLFTEEPVDPILFKEGAEGTVMLYFDDIHNINLGGSKQVTIDDWKKKDDGNSFIIMVAEAFDQTAILEKLNGGDQPDVPAIDINELAGDWLFHGEGGYCNYVENIDGSYTPKEYYNVNIAVEGEELHITGLVGYVYDYPNCLIGSYNAANGTVTIDTPDPHGYFVDSSYEYYKMADPIVLTLGQNEDGKFTLSNPNGWQFYYEDWYWETHDAGYTSIVMVKDGEMPEVEPNPELLPFAGKYLFVGKNPASQGQQYVTDEYYDCEVTVYGNELHLTGFLGTVDGMMPYLVGNYDATEGRIKFSHPGAEGGTVTAANGTKYYLSYFYCDVENEGDNYVFNHVNPFNFYAYENGDYTVCSYDGFKFVQNGERTVDPEGWNGNVIFPETAASIDDLLSLTIEFEEAEEVKVSGYDVLGVIFEGNGNPYAIAMGNETFGIYGTVATAGNKATVNFLKIADLNAQAQAAALAAAARIGGFTQTPGEAIVTFAGRSFKVDGQLVNDMIMQEFEFAGEGEPTGIESINTVAADTIYDLSGRRVNNTTTGLYIKNGVKVFLK